MKLGTGTGSQTRNPAPAPLCAAPRDVDADALRAALGCAGDVEDLLEELSLLRDAATLVTARRQLDGLLLQLAVDPFDSAAYRSLGSYLLGPGVLALAAYKRVSAAAGQGL